MKKVKSRRARVRRVSSVGRPKGRRKKSVLYIDYQDLRRFVSEVFRKKKEI